jgi:hypothetical protein
MLAARVKHMLVIFKNFNYAPPPDYHRYLKEIDVLPKSIKH